MHSRSDPRRLARTPQQRDPREIGKIVSRRVTALQAAQRYGLQPDRNGFCRCPVHGDHDKSLKVYPEHRGWYCFGCGKGGDAINLVCHIFSEKYGEAVQRIDSDFGLGLLDSSVPTAPAVTFLRRQQQRDLETAAINNRLDMISSELHRIYALPRPSTNQHDYAQLYAQILAYGEHLEYLKEVFHHQAERTKGAGND